MARVCFPDNLLGLTSGQREVDVKASTYRDLVRKLGEIFPGLEGPLSNKVAVAIDGEIIHDPYLECIEEDSEIYFLARLEGG